MGLHRDGETYGLNPLDTHVRRLLWHQLCFLDIRTCEAQGPRPTIRREEYDTKLPLNCEEDQLHREGPAPEPADHWTSTLISLIRFEINEMMRVLWIDRRKLDAKQITLMAVLSKIENFRRRICEKYDRFLDGPWRGHRYAKLVMNLLLYRLHAMTLSSFHYNAGAKLPKKLLGILITSGIMIIEIGIQLETNPAFAPLVWYSGAYHQWQIAMLLATEIYYNPDNAEADRIWGCLDYVFNTDRRLPAETKVRIILGEIVQKTGMYRVLRKPRPPVQTARAVPSRNASAGKGIQRDAMPLHPRESQPPIREHVPPQASHAMSSQPGASSMAQAPGPPPGPPPVYIGVLDGQTVWGQGPHMSGGTHPDTASALSSVMPGPESDWVSYTESRGQQ